MVSPRRCGELFAKAKRLSQKGGEIAEFVSQVLQLLQEVEEDVERSAEKENWQASYNLSVLISSIGEAMSMEEIITLLQKGVREGRIRRLLRGEPAAEKIRGDETQKGLVVLRGDDLYIPANFEDKGACAIILRARKRIGDLKRAQEQKNNQAGSNRTQ